MSEEAGIIPAETAAKLIMIDVRHLRRLVADGWIQKTPEGRYTVVGTVQGHIRYLKDDARRGMGSQAKNRTNDARAREIELKIAEREKRLVPLDDALMLVDSVAGVLRAEMEGLAAGVTREPMLRHRIEERIDGSFNRAARRLKEHAAFIRSGSAPVDDIGEDDAGSMGEEEQNLPA